MKIQQLTVVFFYKMKDIKPLLLGDTTYLCRNLYKFRYVEIKNHQRSSRIDYADEDTHSF